MEIKETGYGKIVLAGCVNASEQRVFNSTINREPWQEWIFDIPDSNFKFGEYGFKNISLRETSALFASNFFLEGDIYKEGNFLGRSEVLSGIDIIGFTLSHRLKDFLKDKDINLEKSVQEDIQNQLGPELLIPWLNLRRRYNRDGVGIPETAYIDLKPNYGKIKRIGFMDLSYLPKGEKSFKRKTFATPFVLYDPQGIKEHLQTLFCQMRGDMDFLRALPRLDLERELVIPERFRWENIPSLFNNLREYCLHQPTVKRDKSVPEISEGEQE